MIGPANGPAAARAVEAGFAAVEWVAIWLAAIATLASGAIICTSIVGRTFFGWSIPDGELIIRDLMVVAVVLPLAVVAGRRAHIAIDMLVSRFPKAVQRQIDAMNAVLGMVLLLPILWSAWANLSLSWRRNTYYDGYLELAEWPGRLVFLVGYTVFVSRSVHRAWTDRHGRPENAPQH